MEEKDFKKNHKCIFKSYVKINGKTIALKCIKCGKKTTQFNQIK